MYSVDIPELGENGKVRIEFEGDVFQLVAETDRGIQTFKMERYSEMPAVITKVVETFSIPVATSDSDEVGRLNTVIEAREESISELREELSNARDAAREAQQNLRNFAQRVDDLYDKQYQVYTSASSFDDSMDELKREMNDSVGNLANVS